MRKFGTLLWVGVIIALTVNARGELGQAMSSREVVKQQLERMGVKVGYDAAGGRMVAVETWGYSLKDDEANNDFGMTETYDFSDDASDDVETRHFKAMWKAYADCLGTIASYQGLSISEEEEKDDEGNVLSKTTSSAATNLLGGVVFLTMAESLDDGWCEVTVAVGQSKKREEAYLRGLNGGDAKPGKYTLDEWVKQKSEGCLGIICPQAYCDNEGVWWRVAGVPVDLSAGRNSKKVAVLTEKAKRYAYKAAMRTLAVRVSTTSTLVSTFNRSNDDGEQKEKIETSSKIKKSTKIDPINTVLPVNPSQVRWFELDMKNPMTGKPVRCVVAALRSGNSMGKPKQDTEKGGGQVQQGTAIDQAEEFIGSKGWRTGRDFAVSNSFAVAIGGAAFKYTPSMDGAVFAQKRNDAVRQALMESAMNVALTFNYVVSELKESLSGNGSVTQRTFTNVVNAKGEKIVQSGISFGDGIETEFVLRSEGFKWVASFSSLSAESSERERASVKKVEGIVKSEMPIHGLKVERQFESIVDGVYQIAFVVTCDPKRGRDMVRSFDNRQSSDERGKLPLGQWIAEQDFGMVAGPRQYVDDKGNVWMIGIAPAAEGCRPFGSSLDGMAREYAAFGLSGDFSASYAISSLNGPAGEYSEREAKILYSAESSPTGKYYPKEFELVFHRAFTHPLTGRKGEVSICALRSGTKELVDKLRAEQIIEKHARAKEQERKKGIRDSLLKKGKRQFQ